MLTLLKRLLAPPAFDPLIEGVWADEYNPKDQDAIRQAYRKRWHPEYALPTPQSHPWLFDPCEPPQGWRYDPYYELWIEK